MNFSNFFNIDIGYELELPRSEPRFLPTNREKRSSLKMLVAKHFPTNFILDEPFWKVNNNSNQFKVLSINLPTFRTFYTKIRHVIKRFLIFFQKLVETSPVLQNAAQALGNFVRVLSEGLSVGKQMSMFVKMVTHPTDLGRLSNWFTGISPYSFPFPSSFVFVKKVPGLSSLTL